MLKYDFENSVGYWVCTASHAFQKAINDELAPQGITYRQAQILGTLALDGPLPQGKLAERMRIEPPTLVGVLDRMARDGWICREADPQDRRRKLIRPLAASQPVWNKIVHAAKAVRTRAAAGLTAQDLATLKHLLAIMQQNLEQTDAAREAG
jgi:MarR family transcriptional regulator for hemolysin